MEYDDNLHQHWNVDVHYALVFSKWWCKSLGIWPWQHNELLSIVQTSSIGLMVIIGGVLSSTQLLTKGNCGVTTDLLDTLTGIMIFYISFIKIFCLWFHQQQLRYIILSIIHDWLHIREAQSRKIMHQYAHWGRLAFILQITSVSVAVIMAVWIDPPNVTSGISKSDNSSIRPLILAPSCWIPITMPIHIYLLYYYVNFIAAICVALVYAGCDALMFSAALHICGQFEILEASIEMLSDGDDYLTQKIKIKSYSKRHNHLIRLGKRMDTLANMIILSELLTNSVLICTSGIVVLANVRTGNVNRVMMSWGARICALYMQFFMYCYVGEKLLSHAEKLRSIVYNCSWYNLSVNIAKDIEFIIMRNNYFCHLTGGKFLIMNYESFTKITKSLFSFFSILRVTLE
ncbi:odorant receptor 13a-like [Diachasmimorpha longicaudata]|uniref:odorant receptor 13a-like n=1 Tax=Diachasmimorpha longicaudata TaxID=58733 RepID=UPI0030B887DC